LHGIKWPELFLSSLVSNISDLRSIAESTGTIILTPPKKGTDDWIQR